MFEAIIVSIRVQTLKDRWVLCARTWGHVLMQEPSGGGYREQNGEGIFLGQKRCLEQLPMH